MDFSRSEVLPDVVESGMYAFCPLFNLPLPQEADSVVLQHVEHWGYGGTGKRIPIKVQEGLDVCLYG